MRTNGTPDSPVPSGSSHLLRTINERAALYHLLENDTLTRVELRKLTGLAKPTASQVMLRLFEAGLAVTLGRTTAKQVGPRAEVYSVNADHAFAAAVTLHEPDGVTVAVRDLKGRERASSTRRIDFTAVPVDRAVQNMLGATVRDAEIDRERVAVVHLAVPGAYDADNDTIGYADLPGAPEVRMREAIETYMGCPVTIHNDVNAATVAERRNPAVSGGLVLLWLGREGIGSGIDLTSGLVVGSRGAAGELGYVPIRPDRNGPDDPTYQDWIGAPAVVAIGREHGVRGADAVAVMAAGVKTGADGFIDEYAERVAGALHLLTSLLDPPSLVLGGEIARAGGETLVEAVRRRAGALADRILPSAVYGDAVAIGVLDLAYDDLKARVLDAALPEQR
ncbi:Sugar kinase of the NBD/HSP70 family, may contain an N-terminal HTH domain [Glycomyces sambucus]|uniref:Sugar kinase of the NBD/HSP70 family, may contain an N-terminal HTH domain n=1 Tax=Glycomyces sambucus TaxID=380244 RepID=A0A1G9FMN8_9ACTN|nr:ROK family protein [Glycomyces sambucus]SDK89650.1 Sugar kinase of the NBD/HSP70 family, may contain an N-terminal HTH domain [Glycomyces sambucus]